MPRGFGDAERLLALAALDPPADLIVPGLDRPPAPGTRRLDHGRASEDVGNRNLSLPAGRAGDNRTTL